MTSTGHQSQTRRLPPTGPPLGLMPGDSWDTHEFRLGPGDAILIPADGLLDLHGGDLDNLVAARSDCRPHGDPDVAVKKLCDRRGQRVILDDITAVLFQRDDQRGPDTCHPQGQQPVLSSERIARRTP